MWPIDRPPRWVARGKELAILPAGTEALGRGGEAVVWIEGEPGIGKSSLVADALAASQPSWDVGWGMADQLTEQVPIRVMLDCLQARLRPPDPWRAHAAGLLRRRRPGLFGGDDASLLVWHQLATSIGQLRLGLHRLRLERNLTEVLARRPQRGVPVSPGRRKRCRRHGCCVALVR
jgi:hypothetical protein